MASRLFNGVRFVDHYPFEGVGMVDEPRPSHAHDIWRAQGVTNDSPPTIFALDIRAVIYGLQKYRELLHIRGLGSAKECYFE